MLLDHFHPPLSERRHWHAFHNAWATYIAEALNERLPPGYFAESNVQFGIEIDIATFEEALPISPLGPSQPQSWMPSAPVQTIPLDLETDRVEVLIYNSEAGPTLVGAIELVSPANKDRAAHRSAFVAKCETYIRQGVGLVIVDIITTRKANLHDELVQQLGHQPQQDSAAQLYSSAYRSLERQRQPNLDIWHEVLHVGNALPVMPLWLRGGLSIPVDLALSYARTCRAQRIVLNGL